MIYITRYESKRKSTVWNGFKKLISLKIHVLKKASVAKLYNGIRRYFVKLNYRNKLAASIWKHKVSVSSHTKTKNVVSVVKYSHLITLLKTDLLCCNCETNIPRNTQLRYQIFFSEKYYIRSAYLSFFPQTFIRK